MEYVHSFPSAGDTRRLANFPPRVQSLLEFAKSDSLCKDVDRILREEKHAEKKDFGCDIGPVLRGDVGCTEMVELARLESRNEIQRVGYQKVVKTCQKTTNDGLG